ncbi:MAG: TonB-dependent receptor [Gemmatimonadota bacterium]
MSNSLNMPAARILLAVALVWSAATSLPAQEAADTPVIVLRPIEVIASVLTSAGPSVRSNATSHSIQITRDYLRTWQPRTPVNALERAGAHTYDDLGSPFKHSAVLRGFTVGPIVGMPQGVSVFVDGVPMNEPGSGDVAFDLLPLEHVDRIEILSGTASLLGPNSLGGAINFVTRTGGRGGALKVTAGSHDRFEATARQSGTLQLWEYYIGGGHERANGWRSRMSGDRTDLFASLGRYGTDAGLRVQLMAAHSHAETAGSLPLSVYVERPDSNLTAGDFERLRQVQLAVSAYRSLLGGLGSVRGFGRVNDAERFNVNQQDDPDVRGFSDAATGGLELDWRLTRQLRGTELSFRMGAGANLNGTSVELFAERVDPGQTTHVESPIRRLNAYVLADLSRGPLTLSGGARFDNVHIPFRNRLNPARDTTSTFSQLSPRGGLQLRAHERVSLYTSIAKGFRAPALIEIACADPTEPCPLPFALGDDPPIEPVRVTTYEAGARYTSSRSSLQGTVFRSNVRDDIFLFPYEDEGEPNNSTIDGYFGNVERTRREGLEVSAQFTFSRSFAAYAAWTITRASFQTDDVEIFSIREVAGAENEVASGDHFPLVPSYVVNAGLDWRRGAWEFGLNAAVAGRQYLRGDEANDQLPLSSYVVTNAAVAFESRAWLIRAIVRNALAAEYASFGGFNINQAGGDMLERFLTPGAPRSFELTIERAWL